MSHLFLVRGLPSSGKSTLAEKLGLPVCEADQYFEVDGEYHFDASELGDAHKWCQDKVNYILNGGKRFDTHEKGCTVSNTFSQRWEMQPYIEMAEKLNIPYTVIDLFDGGCDDQTLFDRNKHGVPIEIFGLMRNRYEHDWRNGNKLPPWQR